MTAAFGPAIIIDCHGFPSNPLPYEPVQDRQRPEIRIGADPVRRPEWLSAAPVFAFERQRYSVSVDTPFCRRYRPSSFFKRSDRVLSAMIEVRRDLYMDENTGERRATLAGALSFGPERARLGRSGAKDPVNLSVTFAAALYLRITDCPQATPITFAQHASRLKRRSRTWGGGRCDILHFLVIFSS